MTSLVERLRHAATDPHAVMPWWWGSADETFGEEIGSPSGLLHEAADLIEGIEPIVRGLAAAAWGDFVRYKDGRCIICGAGVSDAWVEHQDDAHEHEPDCGYRQAVEWVAAHPEAPEPVTEVEIGVQLAVLAGHLDHIETVLANNHPGAYAIGQAVALLADLRDKLNP